MRVSCKRRGFTMIEVVIVAALAAVLLLGVVMLSKSTNDAYESVQDGTTANLALRRALTLITDDLRTSNATKIVVTDNDGTAWDSIVYQVPVSYENATVVWGAVRTTDWYMRVLVEDGWLIRRAVDAAGTPMRTDEVLARDVDDWFEGSKGFAVTTTGGLYQITLRVTGGHGTRAWRRTETTSVQVRN